MLKFCLVLLGMVYLSVGCAPQSKEPTTPFSVSSDRDITITDLEHALNMQGVTIAPFEYVAGRSHSVRFSLRYYKNGEEDVNGSSGWGSFGTVDAGKQRAVIYVQQGDDKLTFRYQQGGASVEMAQPNLDLQNVASTHTVLNAKLDSGKPEAVFVYCMNEEGISSSGNVQEKSIESIVKEFEQVVAVFVEIQ